MILTLLRKPKSPQIPVIIGTVFFVFCMVTFPAEVFDASRAGVNAWWNIVFPALLPFFISSELLMGYGVVQFMGVLLEPIMRPLFNLPGAGAFVMAVGYTSGFPISASLTAGLRKANICSRSEAERLLCFTNNASPLFMLVAVGVGMFSSPRLGIIIALSHYSANFLIGLLLRFYKKREAGVSPVIWRQGNILGNAVSEMKKAYLANPRPFGKMLGDAITTSVTKLLLIGGFVIMFSIVIKISCITGIMSCLTKIIGLCCMPLGFSDSIISSIGWGFFEITLGAKAAAGSTAPLAQKAVAASIILGWSGVSVLAQVAAMISGTDLRMGLFALSRLFHSIIAGCTCYFLLRCRTVLAWLARPVSSPDPSSFPWLETLLWYSGIFLYTMGVLGLLALLVCLVRSVYSKY